MAKNAVIFGTGSLAEVVQFYLDRDSDYRVSAFTASDDRVSESNFSGCPVVPFGEVAREFPPQTHDMFVAIGYAKLNKLREQFASEAQGKGYRLLSYVSSKATHWGDTKIGDNVFIFEDNTIQPYVSIGSGTILWSGNHVGHHSSVGPFCFVTSHVVISGHCKIGARCFIGVNATIADDTSIADDNLIGPGTLIQKNTEPGDAYIAERTQKYPKPSSRFFR
jgi:sugar O-acyltransferase (sialic acid O-acetyltransferase NeuD family)